MGVIIDNLLCHLRVLEKFKHKRAGHACIIRVLYNNIIVLQNVFEYEPRMGTLLFTAQHRPIQYMILKLRRHQRF